MTDPNEPSPMMVKMADHTWGCLAVLGIAFLSVWIVVGVVYLVRLTNLF